MERAVVLLSVKWLFTTAILVPVLCSISASGCGDYDPDDFYPSQAAAAVARSKRQTGAAEDGRVSCQPGASAPITRYTTSSSTCTAL